MQAVIIAGGKGARMGGLTKAVPKPMLLVAGRPVLEHQINFLRDNGIKNVIILTGYLGDVIKDYFGEGKGFGVNIRYYEEKEPLGTSGCLKVLEGKGEPSDETIMSLRDTADNENGEAKASPTLGRGDFSRPFPDEIRGDFLVLYGDLMLDMKLGDFIAFHRRKGGAASLVVHPNDHPHDSDLVVLDDDCRITGFLPKGQRPPYYANLVSAAVYILSPGVFKYIPEGVPSDFVKDIFPAMLKDSERLYGYKTAEYIKDMGTPERLEKVSNDFFSGRILKRSKQFKRPAIFMDRDGTLVKDVDLLCKVEDLELFPFTVPAIKRLNDSDFLSLLITNQPVVARNLCDIATVKEIHNKIETLLGEKGAYLNSLYFCPHHPDSGYPEENREYKIDCDCRKPKTGMIEKAAFEYNIDIKSSWFIGDATTDIQTGINAGMKTILVRTGKGGKDGKFQCAPDFEFDDLGAAVEFILIRTH